MKLWKKYKGCFLALILVISMISSGIFVSGAFAQETQDQETAETQTKATTEKATEENTTQAESKTTTETEKKAKIQTQSTEEQPYTMECTFDGKTLDNDGANETSTWQASASKTLTVKVTRNKAVNVESDKKYYICLKVSEMFYFNGLPDKSKITGVKDVTIIKNSTPKVNSSTGKEANLTDFSPYSGEIRLEINPSVEVVTITDIGISCNRQLVGYTGTTQEISDPISMAVVKTDSSKNIGSFTDTDKDTITDCQITKENIASGSVAGFGLRNSISTTGFTTDGIIEQDVTVGKEGTISYGACSAGAYNQVYKEMTIVFHCPYIEKDGVKHYLKFDSNDQVLTTNKQGSKQGYKIAKDAVYNETDHTITYTFENIYLGGYTTIFYTPKFSWPEDMANEEVPSGTQYKVYGANWDVTDQKCYKGANSTFKSSYTPTKFVYYIPTQVDVAMTSSYESTDKQGIAKHYIYKGLTRENKNIGTLGFFDIHNDGSLDSSELKITFDFNTDKGNGATYYVTKVNIPVYNNTQGTKVEYTLTDGTNDKLGTKTYSNTSSFACNVSDLRSDCRVDGTYYIKKISYKTKLQKGQKYHAETAHLYRNRDGDKGLFFGYIEGATGSTASAKMTIESEDQQSITADKETKIESTEISTVSDDDYTAFGLYDMKIDGGDSQSITGGNSTKLKFGATVSSEEYQLNGSHKVNGYHVFRDGIMYICLPQGVSIAGKEQVKITQGSREIEAGNVSKIEGSTCTVQGVEADWWQIEADGINADNSKFDVEVQLATNNEMQGLVWDFSNCVGIRLKNQETSWNAAYAKSTLYKGFNGLTSTASPVGIQQLGKALKATEDASSVVGIIFYNASSNVKLNIARAEAKLEVGTSLQTADSDKKQNLKLTNADTEVNYNVTIGSTDGGYADDFSYYIPVVSKGAAIDENGLVAKNEFDMALQGPITIKSLKTGDIIDGDDSPYIVSYTTAQNLDSTTIRGEDVVWKTADDVTDYSDITAIRIITKDNEYIENGDSYQFISKMKYKGTDFDQMAGSEIQWKSFGHYTYTRNGTTTNTYPSDDNKITIGYQKDFTSSAKDVILGTSDTALDPASVTTIFDQTFTKAQTIKIKKVEVSQGTSLISEDPKDFTGTQANNQFKITCQLNNGSETVLSSGNANSVEWNIGAGASINSLIKVYYSKAMTDNTTPRYIKITFGNDNIDMTYQINLVREIEAANANGSGIVEGEVYQVPKIDEDDDKICSISQNSAFTGLYVVNSFVPGNFKNQILTWKKDNTAVNLPSGSTIIMMPISDTNKVTGYWYYKSDGTKSQIDLNDFVKMSGQNKYSYDTTTPSGTTLRYQFVVNFGNGEATTGSYKLVFGATGTSSANKFEDVELPLQITAKSTYDLDVQADNSGLSQTVSYEMKESAGNDSYRQGKTLALVVTPEQESSLPKDAYISDGENEYTRTGDGIFIIPIGTIENDAKTLTLKSNMFPEAEKTYKFSAQLYLVNSINYSKAPLNSDKVGTEKTIEFTKEKSVTPSLKISGTQVATASEWSGGQEIQIDMKNISGSRQLTVTPYVGLTGTQKATDLLSSVSGVFVLEGGSGTYDASKTATNKLILNSSAKSGTYRLMFEVKGGSGKTELSVPYYIIVE